MAKKKGGFALRERELRKILSRERPKEEIDLIFECVRERVFEYNRIRDVDKLLDGLEKLFDKSKGIVEKYEERSMDLKTLRFEYQKLQQSAYFWRGIAVTFFVTTLGFVVALVFFSLSQR